MTSATTHSLLEWYLHGLRTEPHDAHRDGNPLSSRGTERRERRNMAEAAKTRTQNTDQVTPGGGRRAQGCHRTFLTNSGDMERTKL